MAAKTTQTIFEYTYYQQHGEEKLFLRRPVRPHRNKMNRYEVNFWPKAQAWRESGWHGQCHFSRPPPPRNWFGGAVMHLSFSCRGAKGKHVELEFQEVLVDGEKAFTTVHLGERIIIKPKAVWTFGRLSGNRQIKDTFVQQVCVHYSTEDDELGGVVVTEYKFEWEVEWWCNMDTIKEKTRWVLWKAGEEWVQREHQKVYIDMEPKHFEDNLWELGIRKTTGALDVTVVVATSE